MGLIAKQKGNPNPVEPGTWPAVCVGYADLGTQRSEYQGKTREARKVLIFWDIPDQRMEYDGQDKPRRISGRYTLSLDKKATLRKMLETWRGKAFTSEEMQGFDLAKLVGTGCLLSIVHEDRQDGGGKYAKVSAVMAPPRGAPAPKLETDPIRYEVEDERGEFVEPPESLPEWVRDIVKESYEYKTAHGIGVGKAPPPQAGRSGETRTLSDSGPDETPW